MKLYIKANTQKPVIDEVSTDWEELENDSGIKFTIYDESGDTLFEVVFDYDEVDSDAIYDSAIEMALLSLSRQYDLTDNAKAIIMGEEG
jgi:hypothetical protein